MRQFQWGNNETGILLGDIGNHVCFLIAEPLQSSSGMDAYILPGINTDKIFVLEE